MGLPFALWQFGIDRAALLHALLPAAVGTLVAAWGYAAFRRLRSPSRVWAPSVAAASLPAPATGTRFAGFGLDLWRTCGLLAMLVGTGIAIVGVVPADVDVGLAAAFCAVSVLVVLWYGALTA